MPLSQARSRSAPNAHHTHPSAPHTPRKVRIAHMVRKTPQPTNPNRCPFAARPSSLEPNIELTRQGLRLGISIPMLGHDRSTAKNPIQNKQDQIFVRSLMSRPLHGHDSLHDVKTIDEPTASAQRAGTLVRVSHSCLFPDSSGFSDPSGKFQTG